MASLFGRVFAVMFVPFKYLFFNDWMMSKYCKVLWVNCKLYNVGLILYSVWVEAVKVSYINKFLV